MVLTVGMLNSVMSDFGTAAVAGYGIGARLEFLLIPLVFGLGASMTSLVGVNTGAGNYERQNESPGPAVLPPPYSLEASVGADDCAWSLDELVPQDPATYAAGATYLQIAGPAFFFQGLGLSLYFASQGAGTVLWPVVATILRFVLAGAA